MPDFVIVDPIAEMGTLILNVFDNAIGSELVRPEKAGCWYGV